MDVAFSTFVPFGPPTEISRDLVVSGLFLRGTSKWNHHLVESIFPDFASQIYLIKPSLLDVEDSYCWLKTRTGCYSVKTGYYALREVSNRIQMQQPHITSFDWRKFIWREESSPKLQLFLWKLARGALLLGDNLQHRGIPVPGLCPHCLEPETAIHLFFH